MTKFKTYYLRVGVAMVFVAGLVLFPCPNSVEAVAGTGSQGTNSVASQPREASGNFSPYEDTARGFRLVYPNGWAKGEFEQDGVATVSFAAPSDAENDKYSESMSVTVQGLGDTKMTIEQYSQILQEHLKQNIAAYNLDTLEKTTLGGLPAVKLVYTGKQDNLDVVWLQTCTMKDGKVYILTFAIEYEKYVDYYPRAEQMLRFFNFL